MLGISNGEIERCERSFPSIADAQSDGTVDARKIIACGFHAEYLAVFLKDGSVLERCPPFMEEGRLPMILPSITTLLLGVAVLSVLVVAVWYVSRRTPVVAYSPGGTRNSDEKGGAAEFKRVA